MIEAVIFCIALATSLLTVAAISRPLWEYVPMPYDID